MATSGTNITAIAKPAVGTTTSPTWATNLNTTIDAVDDHDHSTNKGIRITPAGVNINATLEFNQNSASELKNLIFDSSVTASSTSYSIYQSGGNMYWRNGSGTAVQVTTGGAVNAGAGSISGMTGTDAGAAYTDGSKTFNFFTDSGNSDYGKMAHADLLLFTYTNDNVADVNYITMVCSAAASGSSGTVTVPAETGTLLSTATNFAGAINIATSNSNNNIALKPNGTGFVLVGNAGATGKVTSNGAFDLILDTNSGTNSSSIAITDAANGDIKFIPNGTGKILVGSGSAAGVVTSSGAHDITVSTNSGTNSSYITITDAANGSISLVNNGTGEVVIGSGAASGKITSSGAHDLVLDTNAGSSSSSITIVDAANGNIDITPNGSGEVNLSKVDIDAGAIDGTAIGASSHTTGKFTTCDATTDFTIGGLVITDGQIADTGTLALVPVDGCTIALGTDAGDDFSVDSGKFLVEGDTGLVSIGTGGNFETSTTGKVYSKGNCVQTSFHASLIFGF